MLPIRSILLCALLFGLACSASAADVARRYALKEGYPRVTWTPYPGWVLAPGYPGASVVLRFDQPPPFPGADPQGNRIEVTIGATRRQMRTLYTNRSTARVEQYDFDVALAVPPDTVGDGDEFELTAQGTATASIPSPARKRLIRRE